MSDRARVLKYQLECDKVQWLQTHCGQTWISLGRLLNKDILFCVHGGAPDLIYPGTSLYEHILWMHLEKNRTYACTFPLQRKEINVVKVRFTMRYSSKKLSNDKLITTTCKFWRQIACSFQVIKYFIFRQKNIWNPSIFSNPARGSGQKSSRMLITFFVQGRKTFCASFCASLIAGLRRAFLCVDRVCLLLWVKCTRCEGLLPVKHFYLTCLLFFVAWKLLWIQNNRC